MRPTYLFVYGTLMSTATDVVGAYERQCMAAAAQKLGDVALSGALFDAGMCPAAILLDGRRNRTSKVHGELWSVLRDRAGLLAVLDRYEGCDSATPLPHAYRRRRVEVPFQGRRLTGWIYEWSQPTAGLQRILDGRWRSRRGGDLITLPALHVQAPTLGFGRPRSVRVQSAEMADPTAAHVLYPADGP